jgi:hypothetical protein
MEKLLKGKIYRVMWNNKEEWCKIYKIVYSSEHSVLFYYSGEIKDEGLSCGFIADFEGLFDNGSTVLLNRYNNRPGYFKFSLGNEVREFEIDLDTIRSEFTSDNSVDDYTYSCGLGLSNKILIPMGFKDMENIRFSNIFYKLSKYLTKNYLNFKKLREA